MTPILTGIVASGISGHLTPPWSPEGGYDALASVTVPSGGVSTISFAGIPSGYKHLQVRMTAQTNRGTYGIDEANLTFNGDTSSNYRGHLMFGDGSTTYGNSQSGAYIQVGSGCLGTTTGSNFGTIIIDILDYSSSSKLKTIRNINGTDVNGTVGTLGGRLGLGSGLWSSSAPITSLSLAPTNSSLFTQHSQFALYGVK